MDCFKTRRYVHDVLINSEYNNNKYFIYVESQVTLSIDGGVNMGSQILVSFEEL